MKKILILKTGGTFEHITRTKDDFEHWTARTMGMALADCMCVDVRTGAALPAPSDLAGCVITGSHDMVTDDLDWIGTTCDWVRMAVEDGLPMLGICFGHQLMARALGGEAGYHPDGLEIGTVPITLTDAGRADFLLGSLPDIFMAHVTHSQTALKLPKGATLLARGAHDPHHSFRVGHHAWGVQFHPEFDAEAVGFYVEELRAVIGKQGGDADEVCDGLTETPESASLLLKFATYCQGL